MLEITRQNAAAAQMFAAVDQASPLGFPDIPKLLLALEQNGRRIVLKAGDFTLIDPLLPYVGRFFCGSNLLVLKVPRRAGKFG